MKAASRLPSLTDPQFEEARELSARAFRHYHPAGDWNALNPTLKDQWIRWTESILHILRELSRD